MELISLVNTNQGFIMSILTLVYVIATIIIVYYNRKTIQEMQISREEETRPYLFIYLDKDPRDERFFLRIKNYGKIGAKIEKVTIDPPLKLLNNGDISDVMKEVIVAPNQTIELITLNSKSDIQKNKYTIDFVYLGIMHERIYHETYTVLNGYTHFMGYTETSGSDLTPTENSLRNISGHLDTIRRKIWNNRKYIYWKITFLTFTYSSVYFSTLYINESPNLS